MATSPALDLDLVRTLVAIDEEKSFTRAAARIGRTQSAVSLQVQRLETLLERRLVTRSKGGDVAMTPEGDELVRRGRALLAMNDEIVTSLRREPIVDEVRLGVDEGYMRRRLPDILASFASAHPATTVDVWSAASCEMVPRLKVGQLDLLLCEGGLEPRGWPSVELWRGRLQWIVADAHPRWRDDPVPLALSPGTCPFRPTWLEDCVWRAAALAAMARAGRRSRVVTTSLSVTGMMAAVQAGTAITVALATALPSGLRVARPEDGLPDLPDVTLLLLKGPDARQPATDRLAKHIVDVFAAKGD